MSTGAPQPSTGLVLAVTDLPLADPTSSGSPEPGCRERAGNRARAHFDSTLNTDFDRRNR